jgi:hypothetical protein
MSRWVNTVTGAVALIGNRVPVTMISSTTSSLDVAGGVALSAATAIGKNNAPTKANVGEQAPKAS